MNRTRRTLSGAAADPVVRLLVTHWVLGAMLGAACAALVILIDIAGLRGLLLRADGVMWEGLVLMFGGFAVTFGGVVCAGAVMTVPISDTHPDRGARAAATADAATPAAGKLVAHGASDRRTSLARRTQPLPPGAAML